MHAERLEKTSDPVERAAERLGQTRPPVGRSAERLEKTRGPVACVTDPRGFAA